MTPLTTNTESEPAWRYAAFISYSHRDRAAAEWLHKALETYRPPRGLLPDGASHHELKPVFLDRAELPSSSDLAASVREALSASRFLIVVCSPAAAQSRWVNEEIRYFKSLGRAAQVLALVVAGEPASAAGAADDCLPAALRYVVDDAGAITTDAGAEPLAADIRAGGDDARSALLKIAAGILAVPLDQLVQRDQARRQRRLVQIAAAAIAGCLAFAVISVVAVQSRNEAERQRRLAVQQSLTAQRTADFMKSLFAVSDPSEARGQSITAREVLDRGVQQIELQLHDEPVVRADLMTTLGEVYGSLGMLHEGLRLVELAQTLPALPVTLTARQAAASGTLQLQQGNLEAAKASLQRARDLIENAQLADSALYVRAENSLGEAYWRQDNCVQAREAYRRSLRASARIRSASPDGWIAAEEGLAQCDMDDGKFSAAEAGFRRALERQLAATGEMHPRAAELLNEIGSLKYFQGERAQAAEYFERTLRIERQVLGAAHPTVTGTSNNLARVLLEERRFADARALLEPAAQAFSREVSASDPNMTFVLSNLALIEMEQGNFEAAQRDFDAALHTAIANKHRLHGPILGDLADLQCRTGRAAAGLKLLDEARPIVAQRYPDDPWRLAHLDNVRAGCLTLMKRYAEAEALIASSIPALLRKWPPDTLYGHDDLERSVQLYQLTGNQAKLSQYRQLAQARAEGAPVAR
jgi:tetratricopeptide (TPR) repeat protein